jgi:hypothetical protein
MAIERLVRRARSFAAKRHHENRRQFEVWRHPHSWNGQRVVVECFVAHLAAGENIGDGVADQLADTLGPVARSVGFG